MADQTNHIDVEFPVLGENRRHAHGRSPDLTSVRVVNVRGDDTEERRIRGGVRPGMAKYFPQDMGGKIQLSDQIDYTILNAQTIVDYDFEGVAMESTWSASFEELITVEDGIAKAGYLNDGADSFSDAIHDQITTYDIYRPYTATYCIVGATHLQGSDNSSIRFFFGADSSGDYESDGFFLHLKFTNATPGTTLPTQHQWELESVEASSPVDSDSPVSVVQGINEDSIIKVTVDGKNVKGYVDGIETYNFTMTANVFDNYFGFELKDVGSSGGTIDWGLGEFKLLYVDAEDAEPFTARRFLSVSDGGLWIEDEISQLVLDTSAAGLNPFKQLQGINHLSKYYIADFGDQQVENSDGTIDAGAPGNDFDVSGENFAANYNIDTDDHVIELYNVTGDVIAGIYPITTVGTTNLVLGDKATKATNLGGNCSYRIERGPKVYDPALAAGSRLVAFVSTDAVLFGTPPLGCRSIVRYRDRLTLGESLHESHLWFQSRNGVPNDFQYFPSANDVGKAVAGQNSEAGAIGAPITALMPHSDDYLLFGCADSLWVLRGDASYGGQIDNLSRGIGVISRDAYCYGPKAELIFLSRDGIYAMANGVAGTPESISREKMPQELTNIDVNAYHVSMEYDPQSRGVHIMVTPFDTADSSSHFYLSWETQAFWSVRHINSGHDTFAMHNYTAQNLSQSNVLLGGRDGYIRKFDETTMLDDGSEIKSFAVLGPMLIADGFDNEGIIEYMSVDLDNDSDCAYMSVLIAENHDQVIDKATAYENEVFS